MIAALAGVAFLAIPGSPGHRSLKQGLDLQGGIEVVLQAKPLPGQTVTPAMMDNAVSIMRTRVDKLGVSEPLITKQGTNQIVIELPAVHDQTEAAQIIGQTAELELYDLTPSLYGPSIDASQTAVPHDSLFDLLGLVQTGQTGQGPSTAYYLFASRTKKLIAGPETSIKALKLDPAVLALTPVKPKVVTVKTKKKTPPRTPPARAARPPRGPRAQPVTRAERRPR